MSVYDPIFGGAMVLKVALTTLIAVFVWIGFTGVMNEVIPGSAAETVLTQVISDLTSTYYAIDYMFPFLIGGLLIVSTIFAYKTGTNILWGILSIVVWAISLLLAGLFVNVYLGVSAEFPTIYAQYPIMDIIMTNLHWFTLFWIAIISAVMFRKNNAEDDVSVANLQGRFYGQ